MGGELGEEYLIVKPDIEKGQIALHGFRDAVRFFVNTNFDSNLIIAGGVGSIDFRNELSGSNENRPASSNHNSEKSHLLAWIDR